MITGNLFRKKTIESVLAEAERDHLENRGLKRTLGVRDLAAFGVAAIIGAGIFSTVGKACFDGGPGVILLFIITAIACGFSALCYADFASRIPVAGSAYTYSYAAFGEIIAWIIGWDLIMEYAIGNVTVAISWSGNLSSFLAHFNIIIPEFLNTSFLAAYNGHKEYIAAVAGHEPVTDAMRAMNALWNDAPHIGSLPLIVNIPALIITILITYIVYRGIKESRSSSNLMVAFKLLVIIAIIVIGFFYVDPDNWHPFMPNGFSGVMNGVSAVFFAYIGFDAISTTAEECKNPQRDLPRGMFYSLLICTVLYILIALVLTGMVNYNFLNTDDFLANAFNQRGLNMLGAIIALSAIIATTSVLLVFQLGQPRIWMSMSRDGLLPKKFAKIHPKFRTPSFATIITGFAVGIPALFLDSNLVTDLCSIGTLFAFALVCGGILALPRGEKVSGRFRVPYINGQFIVPLIFFFALVLTLMLNYHNVADFYKNREIKAPMELATSLTPEERRSVAFEMSKVKPGEATITDPSADTLASRLALMSDKDYKLLVRSFDFESSKVYNSGWSVFKHNIPYHVFVIVCLLLAVYSFTRRLSLIPVLGLVSCFYLMTELGATNWLRFLIWLIIGLIIYFIYSYRNSKLNKTAVVR